MEFLVPIEIWRDDAHHVSSHVFIGFYTRTKYWSYILTICFAIASENIDPAVKVLSVRLSNLSI